MHQLHKHLKPQDMERYAFIWSEARLVVAAVALLIGGVPPIYLIAPPMLFGIARGGLIAAWILSGLASLYLFYHWWQGGQKVFGKKDPKDTVAFLVMVVSGINLSLVAITGTNFGMSILSGRLVFFVTAAAYLFVAFHLYARWKSHGRKLF